MIRVGNLPGLPSRQSSRIFLVFLFIIPALFVWFTFRQQAFDAFTFSIVKADDDSTSGPSELELPAVYAPIQGSDANEWCRDRFDVNYLTNARDQALSYCEEDGDSDSSNGVTCMWSNTATGSNRDDALCHGRGAVFDAEERRFRLACKPKKMTTSNGRPLQKLLFPDSLPIYWYETGPAVIYNQTITMVDRQDITPPPPPSQTERTTIIVKREGSQNPWHSLMEIMSLSLSLDILQITPHHPDEQGTRPVPLLNPLSANNTQVVLTDDNPDGPYIDLWRLFAKMPVRRLADLGADEPPSNVVMPLAGGSNTLWQMDWDVLPCRDGALPRAFAQRVLAHYNVSEAPAPCRDVVTVTYIRRTNTRRLIDEEAHIKALRESLPHAVLEVVEFETLSFREQLLLVRRTDVLVGLHGAGLVHSMFLPRESVVVEIQPKGLSHQGFRNLAQTLGHTYLRTHGELQPGSGGANDAWQMEAVQIERSKLVNIVQMAVKTLYTTCERSYDID